MKPKRLAGGFAGITAATILLLGVFSASSANAAENAFGTYILGTAGPQAGMLPPVSGVFNTNAVFIYSGDASPNKVFPIGGNLAAGVEANIVAGLPILTWVPNAEILGGRAALYTLVPIGDVDLDVSGTLTPPVGPPIAGGIAQSRVSIGDPQVGALLGWNSGPFHWNVGTLFNLPIGDYEFGRLDNLAYNHFSVDFHAGLTWLDPAIGFELSARAGITVNEKNSKTNYKTGEEFHIEFAALQHFSREFHAGLVGYHYEQISGDSGSGAVLGSFKGRVTALGPHVSWTFPVGQLPVTLSGRGFFEFNTKNRLEGGAGLINLTIPLHVSGPPPGAPQGPPPQ